jgi:hypothetical protein
MTTSKTTSTKSLTLTPRSRSPLVPELEARQVSRTGRTRSGDRGGNSFQTATSLGVLSGENKLNDTVSRSDPDFFVVTLNETRNIKLQFTNTSNSRISGAVFTAGGQLLTQGTAKANKSGVLRFNSAPPGTYVLRVTSNSRKASEYRLTYVARLPESAIDCGCG